MSAQNDGSAFVVMGYWCDDEWPIAVTLDKHVAERIAAENSANGELEEGRRVERVPLVQNASTRGDSPSAPCGTGGAG